MTTPGSQRPFDGNLQIHNFNGPVAFLANTNGVAQQAWGAQLERSPEEIAHVFTTANSVETIDAMHRANDRAKYGGRLSLVGSGVLLLARLPGISTDVEQQTIGYAIVRNDASGSFSHKFANAYLRRQKPFAWVQSINVRPEYQGQGVGSTLLLSAFDHFDSDQRATAYVFDENPRAIQTFENLGFRKTPDDQEPAAQEGYFGPDAKAPLQWRLEAETVRGVQKEILRRRGSLMPEYVEVTFE